MNFSQIIRNWCCSFVQSEALLSVRVRCSHLFTFIILFLFSFQARHGSRRPTKKRIAELEKFAERLRVLAKGAAEAQNESTISPPAWISDWKSPWSDKQIGGELLPKGEEEHYDLAQRYKIKYPEIFSEEYHPDVYPIIATQVQ